MSKPNWLSTDDLLLQNWNLETVYHKTEWERSGRSKTIGIMMSAIICAADVSTVIEIGIWKGFTTQFLAFSLVANSGEGCDPLLISVDNREAPCNRAKALTSLLPIRHKIICSDSNGVDFEKELEGRQPGLIFVDGSHQYQDVLSDAQILSKLVPRFGFIAFHDYGLSGVRPVLEMFNLAKWGKQVIQANGRSIDNASAIFQRL